MECKNNKSCKAKYERWKKFQEKSIPIGEDELEVFRGYLENGEAVIRYGDHYNVRSFERAVSRKSIREILLYGWVIERNHSYYTQTTRLVLLGYTSEKRSLHVVCELYSEDKWEVITTYSPVSQPHKWGNNYQERICFCKEDE